MKTKVLSLLLELGAKMKTEHEEESQTCALLAFLHWNFDSDSVSNGFKADNNSVFPLKFVFLLGWKSQ